jgi:hypothetical protein
MPSLTLNEVKHYSKWKSIVFIDTGTYMGDTLYNMLHDFNKLYSIELSEKYFSQAVKRFDDNKVTIIHGDSTIILKTLLNEVNASIFFWLDGHWSGGDTAKGDVDCPLLEEITIINDICKSKCIIAIDDVRLFGTNINENWLNVTRENILNIVKNRLISCEYYPSNLDPNDRMVLHLSGL